MILTMRQRQIGECLPPWYYGLAYRCWHKRADVYYPMPFNYIVRFLHNIKYLWDSIRSKETHIDRIIDKTIHDEMMKFSTKVTEEVERRMDVWHKERLRKLDLFIKNKNQGDK